MEDFDHYLSTLPPVQQEFLSEVSFKGIDHDLVVHTIKHLYHTTQASLCDVSVSSILVCILRKCGL